MAENATRFWRAMTFRQLNGRRVRLTAHNGELILEIKLAPGFGRSLGSRQNLIAGMKFGELFHEGHDGFMELSRQNADIEIELLPDKPTYETITDRDEIREGDIAVAKDGNHYPILGANDGRITIDVYGQSITLSRENFDHSLRPKLQLPDHPGLWRDGEDNLYEAWKANSGILFLRQSRRNGHWISGDVIPIDRALEGEDSVTLAELAKQSPFTEIEVNI